MLCILPEDLRKAAEHSFVGCSSKGAQVAVASSA